MSERFGNDSRRAAESAEKTGAAREDRAVPKNLCEPRVLARETLTTGSAGYRPIACSLHDRLEAACLHRRPIVITWRDADGRDHSATVIPRDVLSRAGAEYLVTDHDGEHLEIRLDRLLRLGDVPFSPDGACQ
jgi:transcriptional antiterminator Rof (Rho-off)